ncbi:MULTISPECIES: class I SAM-dependent methyltransferase [Flavobacteriaceae]|jgi:O-methyltransferase involved in polyketide biosynthesis|uniref:O-methyltransferase involved in polyketide biosynthesis n=1 Tax=Galbibacter orientalis DSM 19592 TaxID=926559 RepID=I3C0J6_9FLAO|nr:MULTISPECIES: class I SAM-dependent methyltransferase [Flavobacteriaceae]EIJ37139.1 O-methyltransferase involved in polyketide biosynthesis [Galbibacter orientalis DSM 19592]MCC4228511.1 class I SAM-dependent methyltransferase [Zunongwangia profunda]|tara:strand:+ start:2988 stop:3824 length:837 start_codon:yes stop_codon:yes gene_type:complete
MRKEKNIVIHETAFVTSAFRAFDERLSQDNFAKLWKNQKTEKWIEEYLDQVSSEETYTHCLRNRYFLDTVRNLVGSEEIEVLINFGSGFSMYPFLLEKDMIHIEIDKPEIVDYKREKVKDFQRRGILPKRTIYFVGVDFSTDYRDKLESKIDSIKGKKSSFILIEGVLFFLSRSETDSLFNFFDTIQKGGDYIGSASFQETLKDTIAFENLLKFFNQKVSKTNEDDYQTIQDEYYKSKTNYNLIDHQDYYSLSAQYENKINQDRQLILNENFYLLKKI